ncbi:MAG TPA: DNA-formamidopyrimidine glycosylase [Candidatus Acidoferrales bacterium]|nr:DNA-formamidopyrimidine glycosylase [Candidatus Acidoferrales bacterium]
MPKNWRTIIVSAALEQIGAQVALAKLEADLCGFHSHSSLALGLSLHVSSTLAQREAQHFPDLRIRIRQDSCAHHACSIVARRSRLGAFSAVELRQESSESCSDAGTPEVEAVVRTLRPLVVGHVIRRCNVIHPIAIAKPARISKHAAAHAFVRHVERQHICSIERQGKYILLHLDKGVIAAHFRLDGKFLWSDGAQIKTRVDVAFHFARGTLGYVDPRHLGRVQWVSRPEEIRGIATLGPDPLAKDFTARVLHERLAATERPLKTALMDPARIAGLGNIYACESLWRARLDPRRPARSLGAAECGRLHNAIVDVLLRALECCLATAPDFRKPDWWFTGLDKMIRVYGREGKRCGRCGKKIRRLMQGGRSTFVCLRCQK